MIIYTEKYTESEYRIQNNNLSNKTDEKYKHIFRKKLTCRMFEKQNERKSNIPK